MIYPTPEDLARAPPWETYVVTQVTQAALGKIPESTLALGVRVLGRNLVLQFQLSEAPGKDLADMHEIADDLQDLVGPEIRVELAYETRETRDISGDETWWVYLSRSEFRQGQAYD